MSDDVPRTSADTPQRYREAYERGISAATSRPYAMPRKAEGELHQAMLAHAKGLRGAELLAWIARRAEAFGRFVQGLPGDEAKFWSEMSPVGFLRWLNRPPSRPNGGPSNPWDSVQGPPDLMKAVAKMKGGSHG